MGRYGADLTFLRPFSTFRPVRGATANVDIHYDRFAVGPAAPRTDRWPDANSDAGPKHSSADHSAPHNERALISTHSQSHDRPRDGRTDLIADPIADPIADSEPKSKSNTVADPKPDPIAVNRLPHSFANPKPDLIAVNRRPHGFANRGPMRAVQLRV